MNLLARKLMAAVLPVAAYAFAIAAIDPYNYFGQNGIVAPEVKQKIAWRLNPCLAKIIDYSNHPLPNILLGDSRTASLDVNHVSTVASKPFYNLAFGGASLNEILDAFWYADSVARLENVYIGLNFALYSDYNYNARTASAMALRSNPLSYLFNRAVADAGWRTASYAVTGRDPKLGVPVNSRDAFWREELHAVDAWYRNYVPPANYRSRLEAVATHCRRKGIRLHFILLPSHEELIAHAAAAGLTSSFERYKVEVSGLAPTFDYEQINSLTQDRNNYTDPLHFRKDVADLLVREVWSGRVEHGRLLDRSVQITRSERGQSGT